MIDRVTRLVPLLALLVLGACAAPPPDLLPISRHFVIVRLHIDPSTRLGEYLETTGDGLIGQNLATFDCTEGIVLLIRIDSGDDPTSNIGTTQLLFATADGASSLCAGGGTALVQPFSYSDPENMIALVEGPLFIEGETLDGRLPIGRIATLARVDGSALGVLPQWWQISGRAHGLLRARDPLRDADETVEIRLSDTRAESVWRIQQLRTERLSYLDPMADPGVTLLDSIIDAGIQPGMDVDDDGLERFEDLDGDGIVDRCIDGDGATIDGVGCAADPRFADGYELRLIFRTVPVRAI